MADFTSELSSTEIRHAIDETKLQLGHPRRSQEDLEEFLKESQDSDFKLAFEENKCVLAQEAATETTHKSTCGSRSKRLCGKEERARWPYHTAEVGRFNTRCSTLIMIHCLDEPRQRFAH